MTNKLSSYERPFKVKKDGVFIFLSCYVHVLTALYIPMTLKMADEIWNGSRPGIVISA